MWLKLWRRSSPYEVAAFKHYSKVPYLTFLIIKKQATSSLLI